MKKLEEEIERLKLENYRKINTLVKVHGDEIGELKKDNNKLKAKIVRIKRRENYDIEITQEKKNMQDFFNVIKFLIVTSA